MLMYFVGSVCVCSSRGKRERDEVVKREVLARRGPEDVDVS